MFDLSITLTGQVHAITEAQFNNQANEVITFHQIKFLTSDEYNPILSVSCAPDFYNTIKSRIKSLVGSVQSFSGRLYYKPIQQPDGSWRRSLAVRLDSFSSKTTIEKL